jgi:hypothetical protein
VLRITPLTWRHRHAIAQLWATQGVGYSRNPTLWWLADVVLRSVGLPLKLWAGLHVLSEEGQPVGLLQVKRDSWRHPRGRIDPLILSPEASSVTMAKPLLAFAISHYGAKGLERLLLYLSATDTEALALAKEGGFTKLTHFGRFEWPVASLCQYAQTHPMGLPQGTTLHEVALQEMPQLAGLWHEATPSAFHTCLLPHAVDWWWHGVRQTWRKWWGYRWSRRWVVAGGTSSAQANRPPLAYIELQAPTAQQPYAELTLRCSLGVPAEVQTSLLLVAAQHLAKGYPKATLRLQVWAWQAHLLEVTQALGGQWLGDTLVLEHTYWQRINTTQTNALRNPLLWLGTDSSPA